MCVLTSMSQTDPSWHTSLYPFLPPPAVCGMRYKTRPGLSYHINHSHKNKGNASAGGGGGAAAGLPDIHDEGSLGAQSLTPPSTPDGGGGGEGFEGVVVLPLSQLPVSC